MIKFWVWNVGRIYVKIYECEVLIDFLCSFEPDRICKRHWSILCLTLSLGLESGVVERGSWGIFIFSGSPGSVDNFSILCCSLLLPSWIHCAVCRHSIFPRYSARRVTFSNLEEDNCQEFVVIYIVLREDCKNSPFMSSTDGSETELRNRPWRRISE